MAIEIPSIIILDVGHGNCTIIHDENTTAIIDAGPRSHLLEYLTQEGITTIDTVLISHADQDHIAGLQGLISSQEFEIRQVRVNSDSEQDTKEWDDLVWVLDRLDIDFNVALTVGNNGEFNFDSLSLEILGPSPYLAARGPGSKDRQGNTIKTNSVSTVVRVTTVGQQIILIPGDLDSIGLNNLLEHDTDISADILIFPHHGGFSGKGSIVDFTTEMINRVNPQTIIFSIGHRNFPRQEVIQTIKGINSDIRIMCTQISRYCSNELPEVPPPQFQSIYSAGLNHRSCCCGSIVIHVGENIVYPEVDIHGNFIEENIPEAMCRQ